MFSTFLLFTFSKALSNFHIKFAARVDLTVTFQPKDLNEYK
jgi:hypothetical protein